MSNGKNPCMVYTSKARHYGNKFLNMKNDIESNDNFVTKLRSSNTK